MIHNNSSMVCKFAVCILLFMPAAHAADEDIDIPYTDTYGYVYDPATGAFVKQGGSATPVDSSNSAQTTTSTADTGTAASADATTMNTPSQTPATTTPSKPLIPIVVLSLAVAGFIGYRLLARKNPGTTEQTD